MKKSLGVLLLAGALVMLLSGVAFANFGPHGGYAANTDACAGCHRAHTSISSVTWTDSDSNDHSALLVSNATSISDFCYACHGEGAPGASTNVASGVFDAGPSAAEGEATSSAVPYSTNSTFNARLNGGGFDRVLTASGYEPATSMHNMDQGPQPVWGAGNSITILPNLTCTDCHDPHGSANYRLLKDSVNGNNGAQTVGGYDSADLPTPYVWSAEQGYPMPGSAGAPNGGWLKHEAGAAQMATYKPNYTAAEYAWVDAGNSGGPLKNMAMWCSGCHTDYGDPRVSGAGSLPGSIANYSITDGGVYTGYESPTSTTLPDASTPAIGARARHRHPVNVTLAAGVGPVGVRALAAEVKISTDLPLDRYNKTRADAWDTNDYLDCLTCHRAHGVESQTTTGWASSSYVTTTASVPVTWYPVIDPSRGGGVNPSGINPAINAAGSTLPTATGTSSLLRLDNRGVCEVCHNK